MATQEHMVRRLGQTDITVSGIAMGCWAIVGDATWGNQVEEDAIAAMRVALECGITHFDTAEGYGAGYSEELIAKALGNVRNQIVIGSKVSPNHAGTWDDLREACERSLNYLQTDTIDIYHLHWPNRQRPIADIIGDFERLKQQGKIRAFAVSNFGKGDLTELLENGRCEVNQLPYNLLWRVIEKEITPLCTANSISITCYSPIAQGLLTGKFATPDDVPEGRARTRHFACTRPQARHTEPGQEEETFAAINAIGEIAGGLGVSMAELSLAWLLYQPGVASVLVGARNAEQARQNAKAMSLDLTTDVLAALDQASRTLRDSFGLNPDVWQTETRYR